MTKIKITKTQYDSILLREQQERLSNLITEDKKKEEVVSEDMYLVLLIINKLLGNKHTGMNAANEEKAFKNQKTLNLTKDILENKNKIDDLIENLEKKGMSNPSEKLGKNARKIFDGFNKIVDVKNKLSDKALHNLLSLVHA